ncbi:extensin [Sphingobium sp. SCG-1]|uniref:extensin family protein n=1 Tax=Sphingobium sp. SCG-1 TaxID=2072936 RepID=UPI000CD6B478|nr:extensin family protein [Sphingobium sp. SCG-1]AUW57588.1 extensin [Sphingobium sp. SCG-1]
MRGRRALQGFSTRWVTLALIVALSACAGTPEPRRSVRVKRPPVARPVPPRSQSPEIRQCMANLRAAQVQFTPLEDRSFGGGCSAFGSVKLIDIGVPTTNLGAMTCPLAAKFSAWARYGVQPAARLFLGSELVKIETFGTYSCRPIAGSGRLSEHAFSNAVDVSAFLLADGRRISVKNGWGGDGREQQFLRIIRSSACKRFRTVLSPDYNAAHHDHLHFDMGGKGGFCR